MIDTIITFAVLFIIFKLFLSGCSTDKKSGRKTGRSYSGRSYSGRKTVTYKFTDRNGNLYVMTGKRIK